MHTSVLAALVTLALTAPPAGQPDPQPVQPAQQAQPAQSPQPAQQNQPAAARGLVNIRLDLTITDTYTATPSTKTVTLLVLDGERGLVRTANRLPNGQGVQLNVDANTDVLRTGAIRLRLTFEYTPAQTSTPDSRMVPAELTESLTVVLQDGRKLVVSQSADPATDRKVTVEVTATVLK